MTVQGDEHERTVAFAEIALGQIKALRQPADPRNYEIWYTYATGYNPSLNETINQTLARDRTLSAKDLEDIYNTYLSPNRLTDRIDTVGTKVVDEIDQVRAAIDSAVGTTSSYAQSLVDISNRLVQTADSDGVRLIVETLVRLTRDAEKTNSALEARLKISKQEILQLQQNLETVRNESLTDALSGLANRKYFDQILERAIVAAKANDACLSLLIADIDHFKAFNDAYGHLTGDQVVRLVAQAVKQSVKGQDFAARYGGEEFAVILPHTHLGEAATVADHIRRAVACKELIKRSTSENLGRVTVSVGVAMMHKTDATDALAARAEACLSSAKRKGRNLVVSEADLDVRPSAESQVA
jgi:diguanylate cyclase